MTGMYQYFCRKCGYHREGLLDHPAVGIGSYSTYCPQCPGSYESYELDEQALFEYNQNRVYEKYDKLLKSQQPLGEEFTKVLYDNLWDLYEK